MTLRQIEEYCRLANARFHFKRYGSDVVIWWFIKNN